MNIVKIKQIFNTFADTTRLRIVNLLNEEELNVPELCEILKKKPSAISKHLTRLRLTGIVGTNREGLNVYYFLLKESKEREYKLLLDYVTGELYGLDVFEKDRQRCRQIVKRRNQGWNA